MMAIADPPMPAERERQLIDRAVALARALRDERDGLLRRLAEIEDELNSLARKLTEAGPSGDEADLPVRSPSIPDPSSGTRRGRGRR
jgi:hypothetical protein